jgi:hypothetical protein
MNLEQEQAGDQFFRVRQRLWKNIPSNWAQTLYIASKIIEHGEAPFPDLRTFVTTPILRGGLGLTMDNALNLLEFNPEFKREAKELKAKLGIIELATSAPTLASVGRPLASSNVNNCYNSEIITINNDNLTNKDRGTSASYQLARLKRDHPEVVERVISGEIKTARAAMREVGLAPPLLTPVQKLVRQFQRLSPDEQQAFLDAIHDHH